MATISIRWLGGYFWRKAILVALAAYLLALAELSFSPNFISNFFVLNFLLIFIILIAIFESPKQKFGFLAAFLGGFFIDSLTSLPLGASIIAFSFVVFFISKFLGMFFQRKNAAAVFFVFLGAVLSYDALVPLIVHFFRLFPLRFYEATALPFLGVNALLLSVFLNSIIGTAIFLFISRVVSKR